MCEYLHEELRVRWVGRLLDVTEPHFLQKVAERSVFLRRDLECHKHATNVCAMVAVVEQTHVPFRVRCIATHHSFDFCSIDACTLELVAVARRQSVAFGMDIPECIKEIFQSTRTLGEH